MSETVIYQTTFVLKKIDPVQIHGHYTAGKYKQLSLNDFTKKTMVEAAVVPSITGGTHTFRDKNNCVIIIHTTNNTSLKSLPSFKPRCFWCMQDLPSNPDLHVPLPTKMNRLVSKEETMYHFETDAGGSGGGSCCSFECGLAYLRNFKSDNSEQKEVCLQTLYRLCYVDKPALRPAPDFRLLSQYGGTMTIDEFRQTKSQFVKLPNILLHPVSLQFMVQNQKH